MNDIARRRKATFRGIEFEYAEVGNDFGTKNVTHEFVNRNVPYTQPGKRKARRFDFDAYLFGDDCYDQRDRLQVACEDGSRPGVLIHPTYGRQRVYCTRFSWRDISRESHVLAVQMSFVEAGSRKEPATTKPTAYNNAAAKMNAIDKAKKALRKAYDLSRVPATEIRKLKAKISRAVSVIDDARLIVKSASSYRRLSEQAVAIKDSLVSDVTEMTDTIFDMMTFGTFPSGYAPIGMDEFDSGNDDFPATADNSLLQIDEIADIFSFENTTETLELSNLVSQFVQQSAIISAAGMISAANYDSLDQAEEYQALIVDGIESQLAHDLDIDLAASLRDLRATVVEDIAERGKTLSRLTEYTPAESAPALVLSYELYGSVDYEEAILKRNGIKDSMFVPGGQVISVLAAARAEDA